MLAVRTSPALDTFTLFMDTPGSGPSTGLPHTDVIDPALEMESETPPTPRKRVVKSRSRSMTPAAERKYKCVWEGCDKAYTKPSRLAEHELSHTGEVSWPVKCYDLELITEYSDGMLVRTAIIHT